MPFPIINSHTNKPIKQTRNQRKEQDSFLAHQYRHSSPSPKERASAFTSRGSLTVEAALVAPIFFFGILCLVYLLEIISIQTTMRAALHYVGKEMAEEAYQNPVIFSGKMEHDIVAIIGEERLNRSMIHKGSRGIRCEQSKTIGDTSIMELSVRYQLEIPILMYRIPLISREEKIRVKGWTGYENGGFHNLHEDMVYITETGLVYHKNLNCTYLDLSVRMVPGVEVDGLRNKGGARYTPCKECIRKNEKPVSVFITDTGDRYHCSLGCGGLKRSVYEVPISEVYGRGGCSRCVK